MAVILRSNMPYRGAIADLPPINAPMPADAALYADFLNDLHITAAYRGTEPAQIFDFSGMRERFLRNVDGGYAQAAAGAAGRVEYNAAGQRLGMLLEGSQSQLITAAQRLDLTQAAASGVAVAAGALPTNLWDRWYTLTPSGDAAHDLAFASTASLAANTRRGFAIELKTAGHRYVQLSSGAAGDADDYANFDLQTKAVVSQGPGIVFAAVLPTVDGAICYIQYQSATAAVETPTVSIIATPTSGKQAAATAVSVGAVAARLPKLKTRNSGETARVPPLSPLFNADSVLGDRFNLNGGMQSSDFTFLVRARNSPWVNSFTPTLFGLFVGQAIGTGAALRVGSSGALVLVTRTSGTVAAVQTLAATLPADGITTFAFSKTGNVLRFAIGSETYEGELPQIAGTQPFILSSPVDLEGFDGHLQRIIGWSHGKTLAQLQTLLAEGI
ncbi:hypothetical protein [Paracoccus sp. PAR01]|uniref:hypothetical protein n=1 Tax=Paracoccus sp. PAR01 TaxID=2769282 RepID=UPI00177AC36B|nr:hypothetical protein [Paracoccus sp. PAR01]MBD9528370.1 hypothetical protein [Paracoccus sp. PAR01]